MTPEEQALADKATQAAAAGVPATTTKLEAGDFRGNQHQSPADVAEEHSAAARVASRTANRASRNATANDYASHSAAAEAHEGAKQAHEAAAAKHTAAGNDDDAEDHMDRAAKHGAKKELHAQAMQACHAKAAEKPAKGGAVLIKAGDAIPTDEEVEEKARVATEHAAGLQAQADGGTAKREDAAKAHDVAEQAHRNALNRCRAKANNAQTNAEMEASNASVTLHQGMVEHHHNKAAENRAWHPNPPAASAASASAPAGAVQASASNAAEAPAALECAHTTVVADGMVMYMPGGTHTITPSSDGKPVTVTVLVDAAAADKMELQRKALEAQGKKPFFSLQHETEIAAFWPTRFFWGARVDATGASREGVWAEGEWTRSGKEAVDGKDFRTFSPTFFVDALRTSQENPAKIVCNTNAKANMGALENDPAFTQISPLWARNAGAPGSKTTEEEKHMNETIAELQARMQTLEQKNKELQAKSDAVSLAELRANKAELAEIKANIKLKEMEERSAVLEASQRKRTEADADAGVQRLIGLGKVPTRDTDAQTFWRDKFIADPSLIEAMCGSANQGALQGGNSNVSLERQSLDGTSGQLQATRGLEGGFSLKGALTRYFELMSQNANVDFRDKESMTENYRRKGSLALEAASVYKTDLEPNVKRWEHIPHRSMGEIIGLTAKNANNVRGVRINGIQAAGVGPIGLQAADFADASLGTLSGTLVLQRTLPLFRYKFPELMTLFTDFNDTPGVLNQTEMTRIVVQLATQKYDTTLDATGRPKGWSTVVPAQTTDVPLTLTDYISVPIVFSNATLSSTNRRIFDEQSSLAITSVAQYFVAMLTDLATKANYNAYAVQNGTLVPIAYPSYVKDLQSFNLADLDLISAAMSSNKVPAEDRAVLLTPQYFAKLRSDPKLSFLYASQGGRSVNDATDFLTEFKLPKLSGFAPYEAAYLPSATPVAAPTTQGLAGFAFQKSGAILKSRLPTDFTQALGVMIPGSVTTVTDPDTKLSIMLVQYVNLTSGYAEWRPEVQLGAAVGDKRAGLTITSF